MRALSHSTVRCWYTGMRHYTVPRDIMQHGAVLCAIMRCRAVPSRAVHAVPFSTAMQCHGASCRCVLARGLRGGPCTAQSMRMWAACNIHIQGCMQAPGRAMHCELWAAQSTPATGGGACAFGATKAQSVGHSGVGLIGVGL